IHILLLHMIDIEIILPPIPFRLRNKNIYIYIYIYMKKKNKIKTFRKKTKGRVKKSSHSILTW
ncbi:MAG: hypothetical protein N7Q72_05810, partial [Spiroplasma sp. Tabriz.8]|nr:hypothetical protein [Spiroplasma sp. Tabriz.8]